MAVKTANSPTSGKGQPLLPFAETELLAVRLLPAEFARCIGVSKQSVSRWIKVGTVTLGADGRLNPTAAMRQLLRTGNPGRIRVRLVRQAFADMGDLRAQAARADELALKVSALAERIEVERFAANQDYEVLDRWLDEFKRRITETPSALRATLDADAWRAYVSETLTRVMDDGLESADEIIATELDGADALPARASIGEGGGTMPSLTQADPPTESGEVETGPPVSPIQRTHDGSLSQFNS